MLVTKNGILVRGMLTTRTVLFQADAVTFGHGFLRCYLAIGQDSRTGSAIYSFVNKSILDWALDFSVRWCPAQARRAW